MTEQTFFNRVHSLQSQQDFARLSGDFNPVHLDPVTARRTVFGAVVVHGIHNLLDVLEIFLERQPAPVFIKRLRARFTNPLFLNEQAETNWRAPAPGQFVLTQSINGAETLTVMIATTAESPAPSLSTVPDGPFRQQPDNLSMADIDGLKGTIAQIAGSARLQQQYPKTISTLGLDGTVRLLGLTRLVGMQCPGYHSMFSGLDLTFSNPRDNLPTSYTVSRTDERISMVDIDVQGGGMTGTLNTFLRPAPVQQPDIKAIQKIVGKNDFRSVHALIIGGSRGLGELTAKIIAAGGGHVDFTYYSDRDDARRVKKEILDHGGDADCFRYDVLNPEKDFAGRDIQHLFYFATPRITIRKSPDFDGALYQRFADVYVNGLRDLLQSLETGTPLKIFYPSSIAVDGEMTGLQEYARAKREGEDLCKTLQKNNPHLTFMIERLPPLATDQTASLIGSGQENPLLRMHGLIDRFLK